MITRNSRDQKVYINFFRKLKNTAYTLPAKGIVEDLDISIEEEENGEPSMFSCKLGL